MPERVTLVHAVGPEDPPASRPLTGLITATPLRFEFAPSDLLAPAVGGTTHATISDRAVELGEHSELRFAVFPELGASGDFSSTRTAVDLLLDDGSRLSDHRLHDQYGFTVDATDPNWALSLTPNQWNLRRIDLSALAGRTVVQIDCVLDADPGDRASGYLDDVGIRATSPRGAASPAEGARPADLVLTTRGTHSSPRASRGNTFPAAAIPHGFNFVTPITDAHEDGWIYRHHEDDIAPGRTPLAAFSISHLASPWMRDRGVLQITPSTGLDDDRSALSFSHEDEVARAHRYRVDTREGIRIEVAPTDHAALFSFEFPGSRREIVVAGADELRFAANTAGHATFSGHVDDEGPDRSRMFFFGETDAPSDETRTDETRTDGTRTDETRGVRDTDGAVIRFSPGTRLRLAVATSFISAEQAKHSLRQEIADDDTVHDVAERAGALWDEVLSRVTVDGATDDQLVTLYSNLYRIFLYPNSAAENVGTVERPDIRHHDFYAGTIEPGPLTVNNGFWDTYRTAWPALCLLTPEKAGELLDGFLEHYRSSGWLPRWSAPGPADCMVGTSSDIVFADAVESAVPGFDEETAYDAGLRNAMSASSDPAVGRKGQERAVFTGHTSRQVAEGLSWSLENAINDFGIGRMSTALLERRPGHPRSEEFEVNAEYFARRALGYARMFDPAVGFFRGRGTDAELSEFSPLRWGGDYAETNAWGMAFTVPHDGAGLARLYGGAAGLEAKLDELLATRETAVEHGSYPGVIHEMTEARDARMGMLALSNQPAHHIPFMYLFTESPHKTEAITREALSRLFLGSEIGQGYPGDEDNGEMSAWWLFAALGLYPLTPASGGFVITSPLFSRASIRLDDGTVSIVAHEQSAANVYIQALSIDGQEWTNSFVPREVLRGGATLEFTMGPAPTRWARTPPPSLGDRASVPLVDFTSPGSGRASSSVAPSNSAVADAAFDDVSDGGILLPADGWIRYDFARPVDLGIYTVTSCAADAVGWVLQGCGASEEWVQLDSQSDVTFRWDRESRVFRCAATGIRSIRFRSTSAIDIRQLEFFAPNRTGPEHEEERAF